VLDGITAGFQKRLKTDAAKSGVKPKPSDFMFWTNAFMCLTAVVIAGGLGELSTGMAFCEPSPRGTLLQRVSSQSGDQSVELKLSLARSNKI
jgi:hypothetical protein